MRRAFVSDDVDQKETAATVAAFLEDYPYMRHLAMSENSLHSALLDGMPVATGRPAAAERVLDKRLDAQSYVRACDEALECVQSYTGSVEAAIIKYGCFQQLSPSMVIERIGYSASQYYRLRLRALVGFAMYWPLSTPQLIVRS